MSLIRAVVVDASSATAPTVSMHGSTPVPSLCNGGYTPVAGDVVAVDRLESQLLIVCKVATS